MSVQPAVHLQRFFNAECLFALGQHCVSKRLVGKQWNWPQGVGRLMVADEKTFLAQCGGWLLAGIVLLDLYDWQTWL